MQWKNYSQKPGIARNMVNRYCFSRRGKKQVKCKTNSQKIKLTNFRHKYKEMEINVQRAEGGNSISSLLRMLIETFVEPKCKLWRKC